jgi:hypothetical protein
MFLIFIIQKIYNKKKGVQTIRGKATKAYASNRGGKITCTPLMFLILIIQKTNKKINVCQQLEGKQQRFMHPT